jgi:putative DNA primase/helicase
MIVDPIELAHALGGEAFGYKIIAPGPGHSPKDRSLSIHVDADTSDGFYCHSFAGDDWQTCRDHIRQVLGLGPWQSRVRKPTQRRPKSQPDDAEKQKERGRYAISLWNEATEPRGTIVEQYLASRELALDDDLAGSVIRFHPALKLCGARHAGMIALFRDIITDEPCGIHRTFFDSDGLKVERKMLGRAKGAAIKLDADEAVCLGLILGEGIESCLSARLAGWRPVWALGSTSGFASFPVLSGIDAISYLAENDANGASKTAISKSATAWRNSGRDALIIRPLIGNDLNDVWREVAP